MTKAQIGIVGFLGVIILVVVLIFVGVIPGLKNNGTVVVPKTEINFWGLAEDEGAWASVISRYSLQNPTIQVNYTGIEASNYEKVLIDSLAAGRGPDVLLLRNDWLYKHANKALPAPSNLITAGAVLEIFPRVVSTDFVSNGEVWALPMSIETLALAYNRDIFDSKQIATIPDTWDKIKTIVPRLRELQGGKIRIAPVSLGATESTVKNATDIVILLMLQNGAQIINTDKTAPLFAGANGATALKFYTDFSDSKSAHYSIDEGFTNSIQAFANGNTAMVFIYPSDIPRIRAINPSVNMRLVGMPQLDPSKSVNIARYWGLTVSSQTRNYNIAWNFINFATTDLVSASSYALSSAKPPALRSLVNNYEVHPTLSVFAPQILNADSSPSVLGDEIRAIFNNMIKLVVVDKSSPADAVNVSGQAVTQILKR